jgi:hypothetical protein
MAIRQRPRRGRFRGAVATQNNVRGFVSTGGKRSRKKLKVGTDIPTAAEMRAIVEATPPRYQTLLKLVALTGMRARFAGCAGAMLISARRCFTSYRDRPLRGDRRTKERSGDADHSARHASGEGATRMAA